MRFLATGDWQSDWNNLDKCQMALLEIMDICSRKKLDTVIFCGDSKNVYNPIDGRVIKWWMKSIRYLVKNRLRTIFYLGNHDRFGLQTDAQNWLDILAEAKAEVYDKPVVLENEKEDGRMFILPYSNSVKRTRKWADAFLRDKPDRKTDILFFHQNLKGCEFNVLGQTSDAKIMPTDLHPERYLYCIGGDIHLPQRLGRNIYYTGSPFAMDWGEVNQNKSYIVVIGKELKRISSKIPGMYDPTYPNFKELADWKGTEVRVYFDAGKEKDFVREMESAREKGEKNYPGAYIHTVPDYGEEGDVSRESLVNIADSDTKKILGYIKATSPDTSKADRKRIIRYLRLRLSQVGGLGTREGKSIEFLKAKCRNMLSFKELNIDYTMGGVVVINGINADWKGHSNGSGKTSYVQPIPIAAWGKTFKGQTHDNWARRGTEEESYVKVWLKNAQGQKVYIRRGRKPVSLEMMIDGKDCSSGNRANAKDGTQGQIEKVMGFTWQTLANAMYIDETIANAFLKGTRKDRTELLNKFQNLERFEYALKLVREDKTKHQESIDSTVHALDTLNARVRDCKSSLVKAKKERKHELKRIRKAARIARKRFHKAKQKFETFRTKVDKTRKQISVKVEKYEAIAAKYERKHGRLSGRCADSTRRITRLSEAQEHSICPTCYQVIDKKVITRLIRKSEKRLAKNEKLLERVRVQRTIWLNRVVKLESTYDSLAMRLAEMREQVASLQTRNQTLTERIEEFTSSADSKNVRHYEMKYQKLKYRRRRMKDSLHELRKDNWFYEFCEQAMSREGIPAFLNAQLVPTLNKSARYYSKKFSGGEIQIRFDIIDGEFEPKILNAHGGENVIDQSKGENGMAGLITSFALRECAPKSNVLFLDEPAGGLDDEGATQFAKALKEISTRFGTIFLTTFNSNILNGLAGEKTITIVKRNGISRVVDNKLLKQATNVVSANEMYKEN